MKEGLIKDAYELIVKEIQMVITILYLLMVGIGMLFKYSLYAEFGINIFEYANIFDFLIAPFQDVFIIIAAIVAILIPTVLFNLDILTQKRFPKTYSKVNFGIDKRPWHETFRNVTFGVLLVFYIFLSADIYAIKIKENVCEQEDISIIYADNEVTKGKMIGKTKEMMFLLVGEKVKIIPITSMVKEIEYPNKIELEE